MAFMVCKDPDNPENGDAVVLDAGSLNIYNEIDGVRTTEPTTPLKKYKAGYAPIGSWTELPGYWTETPQVIISAKSIPTYYARGVLGQQRFTLGCTVQSTGEAFKYRIYPTMTFYIGSGSSGTITVSETLNTDVDWYSGTATATFVPKSTTPQPGAGTLTVNISWQTRARGNTLYTGNNTRYQWTTNCQIYIDKFTVSSSGTIAVSSEQLVSETGTAYGQAVQTRSFSGISLGSGTCSWAIRKETQTNTRSTVSASGSDMVSLLRLNSYSYTSSAETITNPTGEVFYLAIGR